MAPNGRGWDWDRALQAMPEQWTHVADEMFSFSRRLRQRNLSRVYDLGCGVGRHTVFLAQQGFDVVASDLSPSAIRHTRDNLEQAGVSARLLGCDMHDWPFEDAYFDAIVAFNVVYHTTRDQLRGLLAQAERCLVSGGQLFLTLKSQADTEFGQGVEVERNTFAPEAGVEQGIPHYYADAGEIDELLQAFSLESLIHRQQLPVGNSDRRTRAHWVIVASKP